jgi:predicted ATPase
MPVEVRQLARTRRTPWPATGATESAICSDPASAEPCPTTRAEAQPARVALNAGCERQFRGRTPVRDVRVLSPRTTLMILDNFEQVLPGPQLCQLLEGCPRLKVLVTSRAPLLLSFEQQCLIPPMSVPDLGRLLVREEIEQSASVALFKLRARAVNPEWELTAGETGVVAEICVRLDGLPLAIELAASWIRILTASAILAQLRRMLDLLASTQNDRVGCRNRRTRGLDAALAGDLAAYAGWTARVDGGRS